MIKLDEKANAGVVFFGPEESGKSTLVGQIMNLTNPIYQKRQEKLSQEAIDVGKSSKMYAFQMDKLKIEKERGRTIISKVGKLEVENYLFTLVDTPGGRKFGRNMLSGVSQCEIGVLVLSADEQHYKQYFTRIKEVVGLVFAFGIRDLVIAVNCLEHFKQSTQHRYNQIKQEMLVFMTNTGFAKNRLQFVPISAFNNYNILHNTQSVDMEWYKGQGLVEQLKSIKYSEYRQKYRDKELRLSVRVTNKIGGVGTVVTGRILTGRIEKGQKVQIENGREVREVNSIQIHGEDVEQAFAGDQVGINLKNTSTRDIRPGDVLGTHLINITPHNAFRAQLLLLGGIKKIKLGFSPVLQINSKKVQCKIAVIYSKSDKQQKVSTYPTTILPGEKATVLIVPKKNVYLEQYDNYPQLGRFIIQEMEQTVAVGKILETNLQDDNMMSHKIEKTKQIIKELGNISNQYICPISGVIFEDPVVTIDGMTYEREMIREWFKHHSTSPLTGLVLQSKTVYPNIALRNLIQDLVSIIK